MHPVLLPESTSMEEGGNQLSKLLESTSMEEGRNRLSELPEDLLYFILSRIPIKEAVRTEVLSKRWKIFWKGLHIVQFFYDEFLDVEFETTVNRIFSQMNNRLESFGFVLSSSNDDNYLDDYFGILMPKGVKVIQLIDLGPARLKLPTRMFNSNTLTSMSLGLYNFDLSLLMNDAAAISLPYLLNLEVDIFLSQFGILEKLLKNCESLNFLCVHDFDEVKDVNMELNFASTSLEDVYISLQGRPTNITIDAPNLCQFILNAKLDILIKVLSKSFNLLEVKILCPLLSILESLNLFKFASDITLHPKVIMAFNGLIIEGKIFENDTLKLTVDMAAATDFFWDDKSSLPDCLVSQLKSITILMGSHCMKDVLEFIRYIQLSS